MGKVAAFPLRRLIVQPEDGATPVLELIEQAQKTIRVKQFTLDDSRFVTALVGARARGVEVKVLLNPARPDGTRDNDETLALLTAGGVEAKWSNPAFAITHEKSLAVDDVIACASTFNMSPKYFSLTRDYGIITMEARQVREIAACFEADWERGPFQPDPASGLVWSNLASRDRMAEFMDTAKHTLDVQHPKFVDVVILERIVAAVSRDVRVRVLCSGASGVRSWDQPETFASLRILQAARTHVRRQRAPKLHAKLVLADGKRAFVGSMNIHRRAFDERRELGLVITDDPILKRLYRTFEHDLAKAHPYDVPDPLEAELHHSETEDWAL